MQRVPTGKSGVDIRRIETEKLKAECKGEYKETPILKLLSVLAFGDPICLNGPPGEGKTVAIEMWAHKNEVPFLRFSCTGETSDSELLGQFLLAGLEESWFALGTLSTALLVANHAGRCVVVLEEVNALNEEAQKPVNTLTDDREEVTIPGVGLILKLDGETLSSSSGKIIEVEDSGEYSVSVAVATEVDGKATGDVETYDVPKACLSSFIEVGRDIREGDVIGQKPKLWVVCTKNPGTRGTYPLNRELKSRLRVIDVGYMDESIQSEILEGIFPGRLSASERVFVRGLQSLSKETRSGKLGYVLTTRDLVQCVRTYLQFVCAGDKDPRGKALKVMEGSFPDKSKSDFQSNVRSVFKAPSVDLTKIRLY